MTVTIAPLTPAAESADGVVRVEIPRVLDDLVAAQVSIRHGLGTIDPHLTAYTADGERRGLAYLRVVDDNTVVATVSDDTAYVEASR